MLLRDCLRQGEAQLRNGPHPDRARLDAETLLLHLVGKNRAWLLTHLDHEFGGCTAIQYAALLSRREKGEPIQYITGETGFYGLPFRVTPDVLIPRPETEHLVEKVIELLPLFPKPRILDVGTGSGAIAIALAHEWPAAEVTAVDLSSPALELARQNAERIGLAERIRFLEGDLLASVAAEQFEFVVSNPPYIATTDRDSLAIEVRDHEPAVALFAGEDGLDIYRRLIPSAFSLLVPGGFIALEIGISQTPEIHMLLEAAGFADIQFTLDLQGIPRVVIAQRP